MTQHVDKLFDDLNEQHPENFSRDEYRKLITLINLNMTDIEELDRVERKLVRREKFGEALLSIPALIGGLCLALAGLVYLTL